MLHGVFVMTIVGVDIGGTGIKAATVDPETGTLTVGRDRIPTPDHSTPEHVSVVIGRLLEGLGLGGPAYPVRLGVGFPGVVKGGVVRTAANLDESWIGADVDTTFSARFSSTAIAINDADAAGLAEVRFGAGANVPGIVMMVTLGTGIGSGLFIDGKLVPNTELGHLEVDGKEAESRAAASVRETQGLSWNDWARRLDRYLREIEMLFWPDLIILGGGASKQFDRFAGRLQRRTPVVPASLANNAGIVGAAVWAAEQGKPTD